MKDCHISPLLRVKYKLRKTKYWSLRIHIQTLIIAANFYFLNQNEIPPCTETHITLASLLWNKYIHFLFSFVSWEVTHNIEP